MRTQPFEISPRSDPGPSRSLRTTLTAPGVCSAFAAGWHALFSPIFEVLNTTSSRAPFTDLYDTISGELAINGAFIGRPVVGALFAKLLL